GAKSWPITGATFVLVHARPKRPARERAVLDFFRWGYTQGRSLATRLDYIPMPENVVALIEATWRRQIVPAGRSGKPHVAQ
ncbi:MAG: phosphate ABC transporter substrate-binding protein PstS, partial [Gammaproteobacteria bacterium]